MKVKIKNLPKGFALENGKVYRDGGTTGDQSNYGLVGVPHIDNTNGGDSPFSSVNYSLAPVPRDQANLEAEKGETVLTDMNNDGDYELYDIGGNRHGSGGTPLHLPPQSFIYSDTAKMKLNKYELHEMGIESKKRISPAKVSKNYQLNNFISLLDNEHSDHITRDTAEYMLDKNKKSLSQLAFLQEARKKFDDGVPLAAYPYLQEKGINPLEFSQKIEQISAQEAEQKMMMQLPIEDQLQLLQMKKQQAMMMQQQQMAQQQQQQQQGMGFQEAPQQGMPPQGGPMHQMPDGSMMPGATHGEAPQGGGMPPQGMMPPQPPMQQPPMQQPAMARRGGQISQLLPKAQFGYFGSNDGRTNKNQSLKLAGTTALGSILGRSLNTGFTNRKNWKGAYNDYTDAMGGQDWINQVNELNCADGTCPAVQANIDKLLSGHDEPDFDWFRDQNINITGRDYRLNENNVLQKGDLANAYWHNVKQGVKDGIITGGINYGLNYLGDRTKIGRNVKNWWQDHNLPSVNLMYKRKYGGGLPKAQMGDFDFFHPSPSVQDNTHPSSYQNNLIIQDDDIIETGNVGENNDPTIPTTEQILAQYQIANDKLMNDFTTQTNANMNTYQNQMNSMIPTAGQQMSMLGVTGATDPKKIEIWEDHINKGGTPPNQPDPNYTQAYKNIHGEEPEYENNNSSPVGSDNPNITNVYNTYNTSEGDDLQSSNYMRPPNQDDGSDQPNVTGRAKGLPLDYTNTNSPYYVGSDWSFATGGSLPQFQTTGELTDESVTINTGNTTRPDLLLSSRNFTSEEDMGYHNALGFEDVNVQKYTGMNLGINPLAIDKVPFGFSHSTGNENMDIVDRSNTIANLDLSTGINVGSLNDRTRGYAEGRGGLGWGMGNTWSPTFPNSHSTSMSSRQSHYLNPYLSGEAGVDFGLGNDESIGLKGSLNTALSPYGTGLGAGINLNKGNFSVNAGLDNILSESPTTNFGASYTFDKGGELPMAKKGKEVTYKGNTYSEKELNKLRKSKDPKQIGLYNAIMQIDTRNKQEIANDQTNKINQSRQNTAAVTLEDQVFTGGEGSWSIDYMADTPQAEEYRKKRYDAYVDRRKSKGKDVIGEQEYHNAYVTMQEHNAYFKENLTQEERNTTDWDDGTNDKYHTSLKGSGMSPLTDDMVGHVQSGYIGGQALALTGDEYTEFMQTGVKDQSVFGLAISPEDEKFGNTTNDQRETYTRNDSTEEIGCTNAAGMEAACVEIGGTWTPWDETAKTGCSCDKQIPPDKIPPPEITTKKDTPFWLQDELGMANALDAKMSLKKRYPWAPHYDQVGIDGVFDDPTREIAAISEQAGIAASAATAFGGPQRAAAAALATQGKAMTAIADTVNKVHSNNIKVGNDLNVKNAEMEYKTQMLNNNELKQLYDNTVLTEENYDNSLRKANAAITAQVQNAYTNRANTANLNSIYPQFDIDPSSGGMLTNVNNKTFHADPNYVDPKTYDDNYAKQIEMLRKNKVPENLWPKYTPPGPANPNNSFAKQNAAVITNSGYQGQPARYGRETGRKDRILRKGGQLRNWFSPLRGN